MISAPHGRHALVCGASQGIGKASAIELARMGARVTVVARDEAALRGVVSAMNDAAAGKHEVGHGYLVADFSNPRELRNKVADHVLRQGPVHLLVNNTGGPPSGTLLDADPEAILTGVTQHVLCFQHLAQVIVPGMKEARFGRIVNIISTSVLQPIKGLGVSNTVRGAVANWGRTLAGELAPFGITVNNVLPGYTATDRLWSLRKKTAERLGVSEQEIEKRWLAVIPMERLADPSEIAAVVGFLCSPGASYLTGVNLPVDGGRSAVQ